MVDGIRLAAKEIDIEIETQLPISTRNKKQFFENSTSSPELIETPQYFYWGYKSEDFWSITRVDRLTLQEQIAASESNPDTEYDFTLSFCESLLYT